MTRCSCLVIVLAVVAVAASAPGTSGEGEGEGSADEATITATPDSISMVTSACETACTVSETVVIDSSTEWTSTVPGFGSLGDGFTVEPDTGPIGETSVVISYTAECCPSPADGFIRFRTDEIGVYAELDVVVTVE